MSKLIWTPAFSVGHRALDDDHRHHLRVLRMADESFQADGSVDRVMGYLAAFLSGMVDHCREEEDAMVDLGFVQVEEHEALHTQLIDDLRQLVATVGRMGGGVVDQTLRQMSYLTLDHILRHDLVLLSFLQNSGRISPRLALGH